VRKEKISWKNKSIFTLSKKEEIKKIKSIFTLSKKRKLIGKINLSLPCQKKEEIKKINSIFTL
jgi:hypothetical protein